jgi:hypothetical protein
VDKTVIGLLGAASALAVAGGAQASTGVTPTSEANALQPAQTFAELLDPIPNAAGVLRAEEERGGAVDRKPVALAQYYHHHHHHHHHHRYYYYRHRHHHHHHHHVVIPVPGY